MAAYILSNALFYIKDILPITSGAGATFRISKDLERDLNIETGGVNAFVLLKNSAQIERMLVTCTGGVATIVKRGLEQDGITENANLKKVWGDGSIGYISVKPDDFIALGKLDTIGGLRTGMGTAQNIGATNGSTAITVADTTGWSNGATITGTGIPGGTTIVSFVPNTSAVLSANFTGTTGIVSVQVGIRYEIEIDTNGNEIKKPISNGNSISSTEMLRKRKADGTYEEIQFSTIQNQISSAVSYKITAPIDMDLIATTYQPIVPIMTSNTAPSPFVVSASETFSGSYLPYLAFDRNTASNPWLANTNTNNTTDRWIKIDLGTQYNIQSVDLLYNDFTANNAWANGWKIEGSNNDSTWTTLFTGGASPNATLLNVTFTGGNYRYVRYIGKKNTTVNGTPGLTTFNIYAGTTSPKAVSIVSGAITYSNTLGENIAGNRLLTGIRFSVPYATSIGVVKVSQVATSASARIQLQDDGGTLIAEQTPTLSSDTVTFPNTPISADTVYRLVLNDNANFGNNSNELILSSYQAGFQFAISGTLNGNNTVVPQQIREVQLGTTKAALATAGSTSEYSAVAGYVSGSKIKGELVELSSNDGMGITGYNYLTPNTKYYLSNTPGIVDIYAGTISRIVGLAVSATDLYLSSLYYPGTTITKP